MTDRRHLRVVTNLESRPDLRHPRRDYAVVYRVRVDIDDADPPIWRRIDLRSDLTLDFVHQVLQVAFDWTDSHLHRFSLGGGAFDRDSQLFLCPYDVAEADVEDDGLPAAETRLDETLTATGDVLHYLYDYGDNWELTLRLEQVLPAEGDCAAAAVVDGERAAPPEDCGHLVDAASLAEVLADPARFEPDRINDALRGPYFVLREAKVDPRLVDLVQRLAYTAHGDSLSQAALALTEKHTPLEAADLIGHLRGFQWFLDRAADGGIPLTGAGYLKPADVMEASKVVPVMADWIGVKNHEAHCYPLLQFREMLEDVGLLRKNKGQLLLTRAGQSAQRDVKALWEQLASRLNPKLGDEFHVQAGLVMLAYAAASPDAQLPLNTIAAILTELGWRHADGTPVTGSALRHLPAYEVLINVTDQPVTWRRRDLISPVAAALARRALGV
ncbi:plasmid pRiA4b ORF-3 family protein [Mycolicibacterium vanbaalenii]|uniref:plasmid pRiA4b ORF-3 family protein n=1 Tax=Mycolicibacterium vanbaalenii TaxID=110539 RepID=UPI001F2E0BCF|nr:plasmid pRiA4b ORF-3 family protein [Mycolicibacterium vanbaalenii]UJL31001.1 plasmid pRiA4b ORF-3 family protein [Mycolicibacterium vanbaalenii]WND57829.1 plasmid pRiA4b ORF-3 family protein [Mycolicibacterium vanbaalenii]